MLPDWKTLHKNTIYQTPIFGLIKKKAQSPLSLKKGDFFTIETYDWVNIIALTQENEVILVSQFRHGIEECSLEIPGGGIDPADGVPLQAAKRELQEETGYTSDNWTYLGKVSSNPAIMNNYCHFYLATNSRRTHSPEYDHFEEIEITTLPKEEFLERVKEGEIHHSLVIAAVALWLIG